MPAAVRVAIDTQARGINARADGMRDSGRVRPNKGRTERRGGERDFRPPTSTLCQTRGLAGSPRSCRTVVGMTNMNNPDTPSADSLTGARRFYHGTRADLKPGDLLQPGYASNYTARKSPWIYFSETLHAATWGAELATGEGRGRIYVVEPLGSFVDDPNLTDKKFPGNPTRSYRSAEPLRIVAEHLGWQGHSAEEIQAMREAIKGLEPIDD